VCILKQDFCFEEKIFHSSFFFILEKKMLSRILVPRSTIRHLTRINTIRGFGTHINPLLQKEETADETTKPTKQGRANEIIEAVLYGSKKIKEIENQTHSKMLARGKYVHELQNKLYIFFFFFFFFFCYYEKFSYITSI
jgi:hypothetical protein